MNKYILIFFLFASYISNAQLNENGDLEINNFNNGDTRIVGWKYMADDNPDYANPNYDDSEWQEFETREDFLHFMWYDFKDFGWFRVKLIIPDSLKNEFFSLNVIQLGAISLYINGELVQSFGKPSITKEDIELVSTQNKLFIVNFQTDTVILAVKYSHQAISYLYNNTKFNVYINKSEKSISKVMLNTNGMNFFSVNLGFLIALSILHFLLFIFYPAQKENLYYSLFTFSLSLVTIHILVSFFSSNYFFIYHEQVGYAFVWVTSFCFPSKTAL